MRPKCCTYRSPAVTQQIHSLECMYDCKLFTYKNHRLEKTEAANILERYARAAKLHERDLRLSLSDSRVRDLKIGATKTIGDYFLGDYICRYLSRQQTALTLIVDNTEHLLNLLEDNVLDFAVVEGFFDKDRFDSILLRREPFVGICQREHPFAGREIGVDELMQQTIIHLRGRLGHARDTRTGAHRLQRIAAALPAPYLHIEFQADTGSGKARLWHIVRVRHTRRIRPGAGQIHAARRVGRARVQHSIPQVRRPARKDTLIL